MKCWGANDHGILGLGVPGGDAISGYTNRGDDPGEMGDNLPYVDLGTGETVTSLHAGIQYMCAVLTSGGFKCWGDSSDGGAGAGREIDVGDGPSEMGDNLIKVSVGSNIVLKSLSVGVGAQMCAVVNDGQLRCWGLNGAALGYPATNPRGDGPHEMGDFLPFLDLGTDRTRTFARTSRVPWPEFVDGRRGPRRALSLRRRGRLRAQAQAESATPEVLTRGEQSPHAGCLSGAASARFPTRTPTPKAVPG